MTIRAALFLDRDGVINVDKGYVHRPEDCEFIPGIFDLVRRANAAGLLVFVVTNQAGIARGYYDEAQFAAFSAWMLDRFREQGAVITRIYHCPHHPTAGQGQYRRACRCRKPAPGLLLAAQEAFDVDMANSAMVGDSLSDMQAARAAGVGHRWLLAGGQDSDDSTTPDQDGFVRVFSHAQVTWAAAPGFRIAEGCA